MSSLYIRESYKDLYDLIFGQYKKKDILILGTPGIGKTFFLTYLLIRAIKEKKEERIIYCKHDQDKITAYFDIKNSGFIVQRKRCSAIDDILVDGKALLLIDAATAVTQAYSVGNCRVIVSSSPNLDNYKDLRKDLHLVELHMPVWTFEEIECATPEYLAVVDKDEIMERYKKFGGIPRVIFADKDRYTSFEKIQHNALQHCKLRTLFGQFSRVDTGANSHQIFHQVVKSGSEYNSIEMRFASQYISDKVCTAVTLQSVELEWLMQSSRSIPSMGAFRGYLFEPIAFLGLVEEHTYKVRAVLDGTTSQLDLKKKERIIIDDFDSLDLNKEYSSAFLIPRKKNNTTWDSLAPPTSIFQVTVSLDHGMKEEGLEKAITFLDELAGKSQRYSYYWVVPYENIGKFTAPKLQYKILSRVDQYVLQYKKIGGSSP